MQVFLFAALLALSALDAWTTVQILRRGGVEQNGLVARLMQSQGVQAALGIVKGLFFAAVLAALGSGWVAGPAATQALILADIAFAVIVVHNLVHLRRARRNG